VTPKYQWYYLSGSTKKTISGATKVTYTPTSTYVGKTLGVKITASSPDFNTPAADYVTMTGILSAESFADLVPRVAAPVATFPDALSPGAVSTVVHGTGYPTGTTFTYQWLRNGAAISGATKTSYTATTADVGASLSAQVTAKKTGFANFPDVSNDAAVSTAPPIASTTDPSIPSATVGATVTANPGTWNTSGLTFTYQWFRNAANSDPDNALSAIPGATSSTFVVPSSAYKDELRVEVTAHKTGQDNVTVTSNVVVVKQAAQPTEKGAKIVAKGSVYSIGTPVWSVDGLTFTYQWYLNAIAIPGATSDSYTRSDLDNSGGGLSLDITATRVGYPDGGVTLQGPPLAAAP
jgi:hypothetical protein